MDDGFPEHEKVAGLSDAAFRVHVTALCWCARRETDGRVPDAVARRLGASPKIREELRRAGLWDPGEGASHIHDYLEYNLSKAQLDEQREIAARRSVLRSDPEVMRALKARDRNRCRYCDAHVDWANRRGRTGGTYDHVIPISKGGTDSVDNIVVCCRLCNSRKGCRTPTESGMVLLPIPTGSLPVVPRSPVPVPGPDPVTQNKILTAAASQRPGSLPRAQGSGSAAAAAADKVIEELLQEKSEQKREPTTQVRPKTPEKPAPAPQKPRLPGNLEEALRVPICERAELITSGKVAAQWLEPQKWPEVVGVEAELAAGEGRKPLPLGSYDRDNGVRAVVELYAIGFMPGDVKRVARKLPSEAWWRSGEGKRGLATLSPEVMRRALAAGSDDGGLLERVKADERARLRRGEPESGAMPIAGVVGDVLGKLVAGGGA